MEPELGHSEMPAPEELVQPTDFTQTLGATVFRHQARQTPDVCLRLVFAAAAEFLPVGLQMAALLDDDVPWKRRRDRIRTAAPISQTRAEATARLHG